MNTPQKSKAQKDVAYSVKFSAAQLKMLLNFTSIPVVTITETPIPHDESNENIQTTGTSQMISRPLPPIFSSRPTTECFAVGRNTKSKIIPGTQSIPISISSNKISSLTGFQPIEACSVLPNTLTSINASEFSENQEERDEEYR
jgi:hypothetical protein